MTATPHEDIMLNINDFGPIADAENVFIKPMTVFVGPSNTGKSYLAILLYAISKGLNDAFDRVESGQWQSYYKHFSTLRSGIRNMPMEDIISSEHNPHRVDESLVIYDWKQSSDEVQHIVAAMHSDWLEFASNTIDKSITAFFDVSRINELALHSAIEHVVPHFMLCQHEDPFDWNIEYNDNSLKVDSGALPRLMLPESVAMILATETDERETALNDFSMFHLLRAINTSFGAQFHSIERSTYFPAARSGIIASHRTLNRNLVASIARSNLDREAAIPYNQVVNDFLEKLLRIGRRVRNSDYDAIHVAETLESFLMDGTITAKDSQYGAPEFIYSQNELTIPLSRSSSMVTEIAPIVLFLKHFLWKGELLIIEEPEAHLHPAAQQKFAAALALMVRNGFRILITTHSHYMVEQVSDFVAASNLSPEKRRDLLRLGPVLEEQDIYLNEDEVGVYGFDNSSGSTIVKNIPFDESFAYVPEDHNQALTEQFNRNVRIMRAQSNGHSVNGHDGE